MLAALYDRHVAEVHRYVHRRCRDRAQAEDITQDAFLAAVRTFDDPADITVGWLISTARNRLIDIVRREARYERKLRLVQPPRAQADDTEIVPDRLRLREALEALRVEHRVVLVLHYLDGLTVDALAEEMGRTPKGAEALLTRARRSLVTELERADA